MKNLSSSFGDKSTFLKSIKDLNQDLRSQRWLKHCNLYIFRLLRLCKTTYFLLLFDRPNDLKEMNCFLRRVIMRNAISLFTKEDRRDTLIGARNHIQLRLKVGNLLLFRT